MRAQSIQKLIFVLILFSFIAPPLYAQDWKTNLQKSLKNGGGYAIDENGKELFAYRENDKFIPASVIKVATIFAALENLGADYRFTTDFYLTPDGGLGVKGYGDPYLISEVLNDIAQRLAKQNKSFNGMVLDDSYFAEDLKLDGTEGSNNPYDAENGALIANFNTVNIKRLAKGKIVSAEAETPLVPLAEKIAKQKPGKVIRFNIGSNRETSVQYFGQLLKAFLESDEVKVKGEIIRGPIPKGSRLIYKHACPKTLWELSQHILEFSTNFGANQIFLKLGAHKNGEPATYEKGASVVSDFLRNTIHLQDFNLVEGSGLSRKTLVKPKDMVTLVNAFSKYPGLLPLKEGRFTAKTGTLTGVNSMAGFMEVPGKGRVSFAFLVNSDVPFTYKFMLGNMLYEGLTKGS
jgi:D-alanyl-D-alanine carboxypeptidase/D-alanyl-D-alanine-endopeptidase (penicillin-binding protein 4)